MNISIGIDQANLAKFRTATVKSMEELADLIIKEKYSLSTFTDGYRKASNFIQARAIGLDFDSGMTLEEATEAFKDYQHIIAPSKSHGIEKKVSCLTGFGSCCFSRPQSPMSKPLKQHGSRCSTNGPS